MGINRGGCALCVAYMQGRSRTVPRVLSLPVTSGSRGGYGLSPTHDHASSKHSSSHDRKRLQPIGADAKPRAGERTLNGISKRSSLVLEPAPGSKDTAKQVLIQQSSQDGKKSSSSSTTDQTSEEPVASSKTVGFI